MKQYLKFSSTNNLEHASCVLQTLFHQAEAIVSYPNDRGEEKTYIKKGLG